MPLQTRGATQARASVTQAMAAVDERLATGASYDFAALAKVAQRVDEDLPGDTVRAYLDQQVAAGKVARIPVGEGMVRYQRRHGRPVR